MSEENLTMQENVFKQLYDIDTRDRAITKDTGRTKLDYLPWAVTYSEVAKRFPDMKYKFCTFESVVEKKTTKTLEDGSVEERTEKYVQTLPYNDTPAGLEVVTWVSINGVKKYMRLPVYDSQYKSMRLEPYTYETKNGTREVPAATIADIYKSIMRCFAKNLSMWGVGLNFWTKEDAPESVLKIEKLIKEIDGIYVTKKKKGFTDEELLAICGSLLPTEFNGNYHLCDNEEILESVKKKLLATRKTN